MRSRIFSLGFLSLLLTWLFPVSLPADDTNYQNYLVGDRAAGMGGAVAATTADLDACYYNPAGLADVSGSRVALSVSLYGIQSYRLKDGLGPGEDLKARQFETIPSTFGSILKASDDLALAFAVLTPDSLNSNISHSFERRPDRPGVERSDYYDATLDDSTLWIGPSLGWRAGERLKVGAGVYVVYRSLVDKQDWAYLYTTSDTREVVEVRTRVYNINYTNYGLLGMAGTQYELSEEFVLGAVVQTPTWNITGDGELLYAVSLGSPEDDQLIQAKNMKSRNNLPAKFSLGAAWRKAGLFTLEGNLSYHLPTSYQLLAGEDVWTGRPVTTELRRKGVVNFNLGGEYRLAGNYPLRAGIFTNLSSSPGIDESDPAGSQEKIDMYGVSFSVGNESEHTTISLGVNYVWGKGETVGIGEDFQPTVVDQRESHLFLFLSSAYIF
ncbi:MAG: outer membrane protein transport protein [Candidatus Erginobacter occultus]|nr:outer membrane protein transport protein [Candidatus Erginobacter occultus]